MEDAVEGVEDVAAVVGEDPVLTNVPTTIFTCADVSPDEIRVGYLGEVVQVQDR